MARNKASKNPASSRFDDGNEGSGGEEEQERVAEAKLSRFESRFEQQEKNRPVGRREDDDDDPEEEVGSGTPPVMEAVKSKEEILEEMGLNIRRLMTGLLLEVG